MQSLALILSELNTKHDSYDGIWQNCLLGNVAFYTNRLGSDGVANTTEYQAQAIEQALQKKCFIITGRISELWSGKTRVEIIKGLDIPHELTQSLLQGAVESEDEIAKEVKSISLDLEQFIKRNNITLLFSQNTNSICYNLSSSIALINVATLYQIPVIHQCFDFFWEHSDRNRNIFKGLNANSYINNLFYTVANWNKTNWRWTFHSNSFRKQATEEGLLQTKTHLLTTPIGIDDLPHANHIDIDAQIEHNSPSIFNRFKICYGEVSDCRPHYKILIPSKISRKKQIFETIEVILDILSKQRPGSCLSLAVTGAFYDNENGEGQALLETQLQDLLLMSSSCKGLSYIAYYFLNGVKRFQNDWLSVPDLISWCDIVAIGSDTETDCVTVYESCLMKKMVWMRPWKTPHNSIFEELFKSHVISPLTKSSNGVLFPFEYYSQAVVEHNYRASLSARSKDVFVRQLIEILDQAKSSTIEFNTKVVGEILEGWNLKQSQYLVLLRGAPRSGKSALSEWICKELRKNGVSVAVISLDDYSVPIELTRNKKYEPGSIEVKRLLSDIKVLRSGGILFRQEYLHRQRKKAIQVLQGIDILIVEGVFAGLENATGFDGGSYDVLKSQSDQCIVLPEVTEALERCIQEDIDREFSLHDRHDRLLQRLEQINTLDQICRRS